MTSRLPHLMDRKVPLTVLARHVEPTPVVPAPRFQIRIGQALDWLRSLSPWVGGDIVIRGGIYYQWLIHRVSGIKRLHRIKGQRFEETIILTPTQTTEIPAWMRGGE